MNQFQKQILAGVGVFILLIQGIEVWGEGIEGIGWILSLALGTLFILPYFSEKKGGILPKLSCLTNLLFLPTLIFLEVLMHSMILLIIALAFIVPLYIGSLFVVSYGESSIFFGGVLGIAFGAVAYIVRSAYEPKIQKFFQPLIKVLTNKINGN